MRIFRHIPLIMGLLLATACIDRFPIAPSALTPVTPSSRIVTATSIADGPTATPWPTETAAPIVPTDEPSPVPTEPQETATFAPTEAVVVEEATVTVTIENTVVVEEATVVVEITAVPTLNLATIEAITPAPIATETINPTVIPDATNTPQSPIPNHQSPNTFRVHAVAPQASLNIRSGPGVGNEVVTEFSPQQENIVVTGAGEVVAGSLWVPVELDGVTGWVNSRYITPALAPDAFCARPQTAQLNQQSVQALAADDSVQTLLNLTHPTKGLGVYMAWWNPVVHFRAPDVPNLLNDVRNYEFGVETGSGEPIQGTFANIVAPLLRDVVSADSQTACQQILAGGTAGFIKLPDELPNLNYYAIHKPATDEFPFDWGTWVIGMEEWQGNFYITHLIYYQWEI